MAEVYGTQSGMNVNNVRDSSIQRESPSEQHEVPYQPFKFNTNDKDTSGTLQRPTQSRDGRRIGWTVPQQY